MISIVRCQSTRHWCSLVGSISSREVRRVGSFCLRRMHLGAGSRPLLASTVLEEVREGTICALGSSQYMYHQDINWPTSTRHLRCSIPSAVSSQAPDDDALIRSTGPLLDASLMKLWTYNKNLRFIILRSWWVWFCFLRRQEAIPEIELPFSLHTPAQLQFRLHHPQLRLMQQHLRLATVTGS